MAAVVLLAVLIVGLIVLWRENQAMQNELAGCEGVCRTSNHSWRESE